ncbi:MAG: nitroreductase [Polyangiales bacterium]|nr:nitroreductase [Myxococcales bacterium]
MSMDFDEAVRARRSVRGFKPDPVPEEVIAACLELAQHTPSNCNVQPWRVYLASGGARDRVRSAMLEEFAAGRFEQMEHPIDTFPGDYRKRQVACAVEMYGKMGVGRDDMQGRLDAHARNFALFDAPHVAVVCMHRSFGLGVALDVGMWVQTFMLALTSRGVGSCPQAALRAYAGLLARELAIPDDELMLCGVSFGYEDESVPVNATRQPRDPVDVNVKRRA